MCLRRMTLINAYALAIILHMLVSTVVILVTPSHKIAALVALSAILNGLTFIVIYFATN